MDKNTIAGLVVITAMLVGFSIYNGKQGKAMAEERQRVADSIALVQRETAAITDITRRTETEEEAYQRSVAEAMIADSLQTAQVGSSLATARSGQEETFPIENDLMVVTFSNKGGKIAGVELKGYENQYKGGKIQLYAPNSAYFDLKFYIERNFNNIEINTEDYFFTPANVASSEDGANQYVSMRLYVDTESYLEYLYTISKEDYMIDYAVRFVNMGEMIRSNEREIMFTWEGIAPRTEKGFQNENNATTVSYKFPGKNSIESLKAPSNTEGETINSRVQWIGFKQQFFSSIFIADENFANAEVKYDTYKEGNANIKRFHASMAVEFDKNNPEYGFSFYYGPNKYKTLKKYDISAERLIPLGGSIIGVVNRWVVIPVFDWLEKTGVSYGLIILILTLIIKVIIFPLTYKSYLSTAKMRILKPEIDEITARYPKQEDAMKRQQATMDLYKRAGVSPMGGCLPMIIQFPILIAMFRFFPASIELRGQSFLWASDLSSYDSILQLPFNIPFYGDHVSLFTLLMAVSMHITSRISYAQQPANNQPGMGGMKVMMLWLMPVMLMVWFNNYASGLSYYYLLSNLITMGQTLGMRYIVNDEKLHAKLKQNAAKKKASPKKKSKWQQRYEEMVKEQQRIQQQQGGAKKK